ncbi:MAG: hypothetical protein IJI73_11445, partial [Kiritimatiellae bacterium]|nr:hypothetical protein [Kiritimatiellia bacterium]
MNKTTAAAALIAALSLSSFAYEGPTFAAAVWRGETAYVRIPGCFAGEMLRCAAHGMKESGVEVDLLCLDSVVYDAKPGSEFLCARRDVLRPISPK